jgi:hypothetical protein
MSKPILDVPRDRRNVITLSAAQCAKAGAQAQKNGGFVHDTPFIRKIRADHRLKMARLARAEPKLAKPAMRQRSGRTPRRPNAPRPKPAAKSGTDDGPAEPPRRRPGQPVGAPDFISDKSADHQLGLTGRQYLAFLRKYNVPYVKLGRRVLARRELVVVCLDRLSGVTAPVEDSDERLLRLAAGGSR